MGYDLNQQTFSMDYGHYDEGGFACSSFSRKCSLYLQEAMV
jgi:hypothetical protein